MSRKDDYRDAADAPLKGLPGVAIF